MGRLVNKVAPLLARKGWNVKTFAAHCMLAGAGQDAAYRLARGETSFNTRTLAIFAQVLGVNSICEIIDIEPGDEEQQ